MDKYAQFFKSGYGCEVRHTRRGSKPNSQMNFSSLFYAMTTKCSHRNQQKNGKFFRCF